MEHLTVAKFPPSDNDKHGRPIDTTTVQYQESLQAYQDWAKKDGRSCFTMLYFMHDDLIGEFEVLSHGQGHVGITQNPFWADIRNKALDLATKMNAVQNGF